MSPHLRDVEAYLPKVISSETELKVVPKVVHKEISNKIVEIEESQKQTNKENSSLNEAKDATQIYSRTAKTEFVNQKTVINPVIKQSESVQLSDSVDLSNSSDKSKNDSSKNEMEMKKDEKNVNIEPPIEPSFAWQTSNDSGLTIKCEAKLSPGASHKHEANQRLIYSKRLPISIEGNGHKNGNIIRLVIEPTFEDKENGNKITRSGKNIIVNVRIVPDTS